jgi:hypothetical protein
MIKPGLKNTLLTIIILLMMGGAGWALPVDTARADDERPKLPLVIVAVDKMDSLELLESKLPGVNRLLANGACGLMNVRSGMGYMDSASGYLSLGTGSRSTMPDKSGPELSGGAYELENRDFPGGNAGSYLQWSIGPGVEALGRETPVVPKIGWIKNQAWTEDHQVDPGRLGAVFHENGWRTCLVGNLDNISTSHRPGGLLLMDRRGIMDEGQIGQSILEIDPGFPYQYRFSSDKAIGELSNRLAARKIILVEFGDFYRLDFFREEVQPDRYEQLKRSTWLRFDGFLTRLFRLKETKPFTLVVITPSVSSEGVMKKNLLGVFVVSDPGYHPGLLTSGTTKWPGLVANIDFLPTLLQIANLQSRQRLIGRAVTAIPAKDYRQRLAALNQRLIASNSNQRRILDWDMAVITFGWLAGLLGIYLVRIFLKAGQQWGSYLRVISDWLITLVAIMPLSLIILPLLPIFFWQVGGFLALSIIISIPFIRIRTVDRRIVVLSGLIWGGLVCDQLFGWHLIRFSPLGYSAMAGSRYYGIGNEFMGVFLAASLILTHLISRDTTSRWKAPQWFGPLILGGSVLVFSLPQLGAKFGGILSGIAGFSYYLVNIYQVKLHNKKLWFIFGGCILGLAAIGWWDSLRAPEVQTHIGRFVRLFFNRDFAQVGEIIFRKLTMNMKLTVFSPWMRIILLALMLGIVHRVVAKSKLAQPEDMILWKSILVTGMAAYIVNDAGVLAFATCLAYGFSFVLLKLGNSVRDKRELTQGIG